MLLGCERHCAMRMDCLHEHVMHQLVTQECTAMYVVTGSVPAIWGKGLPGLYTVNDRNRVQVGLTLANNTLSGTLAPIVTSQCVSCLRQCHVHSTPGAPNAGRRPAQAEAEAMLPLQASAAIQDAVSCISNGTDACPVMHICAIWLVQC